MLLENQVVPVPGERPWSCQYCTRRFLHRDTYKAHLRRHLGDRPHKCHSCSRSFAERWALRRHERVHSGEKPYGCPECDRTFSDSSNRQKHLKTHNITTSEDSVTKKMPVKGVKCSNIKPKVFTDQHENQVDFEGTLNFSQHVMVVSLFAQLDTVFDDQISTDNLFFFSRSKY